MAIDTAAKRLGAMATKRLPWFRRFTLPRPDGTIDQGDRQQVAYVYRGILAPAADPFVPGMPTWVQPRRGVVWLQSERGRVFDFPVRSTTWLMRPGVTMSDNTIPVVTGYDQENRLYSADFRFYPELSEDGGMEIESVVINQIDDLTDLGATLHAISGTIVQIRIPQRPESGRYKFEIVCTLDVAPNVIVGYGSLDVP